MAGALVPQAIIPAYLATSLKPNMDGTINPSGIEDLNSIIGMTSPKGNLFPVTFMDHGMIDNFDYFSVFLERLPYTTLNFDTRSSPLVITDPVYNLPENREKIAEVVFESNDFPGLSIQKQPICSILSNLHLNKNKELTGLVVDAGDGACQITPVCMGFPILSLVTQIPLAGKDVTFQLTKLLREREKIPAEHAFEIASWLKQTECYVCQDPVKEFAKYDADPQKYFLDLKYKTKNGKTYQFKTGYERFMAGEFFFAPDTLNDEYKKPLPDLCIETIGRSPVDFRRRLALNINLSGGSTMFKNLDRRLQIEMQQQFDDRLEASFKATGYKSKPFEVCIPKDKNQLYRVFFGASMLANDPQFLPMIISKEMYNEHGPKLFRKNHKITV
ncbi:MAG: Actin-related protein 3B [Marteilia pararefringens]